jgi:hypothetical protein
MNNPRQAERWAVDIRTDHFQKTSKTLALDPTCSVNLRQAHILRILIGVVRTRRRTFESGQSVCDPTVTFEVLADKKIAVFCKESQLRVYAVTSWSDFLPSSVSMEEGFWLKIIICETIVQYWNDTLIIMSGTNECSVFLMANAV